MSGKFYYFKSQRQEVVAFGSVPNSDFNNSGKFKNDVNWPVFDGGMLALECIA